MSQSSDPSKVLIIDASPASARVLKAILDGKDNVVAETYVDTMVARHAMSSHNIGGVFIDIFSLDVGDGIKFIDYVRKTNQTIPLCLYSHKAQLQKMSNVDADWRDRFEHFFKLYKDHTIDDLDHEAEQMVQKFAAYRRDAIRRHAGGNISQNLRSGGVTLDAGGDVAVGGDAVGRDKVINYYTPSHAQMLSREKYRLDIVNPMLGAKTGHKFQISGTYGTLPSGQFIWVSTTEEVEDATLRKTVKHYWPQGEATTKDGKKWYAQVDYVGGIPGDLKTILVHVVGRNGRALFDYFRRAGGENWKLFEEKKAQGVLEESYDRWPSIIDFTDDIVECASVQIII